MTERTATLLAWLESEGERHRRTLPHAGDDLLPPGCVQASAFALAVLLALGVTACGLQHVRETAARISCMENLRRFGFRWQVDQQFKPTEFRPDTDPPRVHDRAPDSLPPVGLFAVLLGTVVGAPVYRAGAVVSNMLTRQRYALRVPVPPLWKAACVAFAASVATAVAGASPWSPAVVLAVVTAAGAALLPTTPWRGFLVALCNLFIGLVGVAVFAVIFWVLHVVPY